MSAFETQERHDEIQAIMPTQSYTAGYVLNMFPDFPNYAYVVSYEIPFHDSVLIFKHKTKKTQPTVSYEVVQEGPDKLFPSARDNVENYEWLTENSLKSYKIDTSDISDISNNDNLNVPNLNALTRHSFKVNISQSYDTK
jgi:hypothetical protein